LASLRFDSPLIRLDWKSFSCDAARSWDFLRSIRHPHCAQPMMPSIWSIQNHFCRSPVGLTAK